MIYFCFGRTGFDSIVLSMDTVQFNTDRTHQRQDMLKNGERNKYYNDKKYNEANFAKCNLKKKRLENSHLHSSEEVYTMRIFCIFYDYEKKNILFSSENELGYLRMRIEEEDTKNSNHPVNSLAGF